MVSGKHAAAASAPVQRVTKVRRVTKSEGRFMSVLTKAQAGPILDFFQRLSDTVASESLMATCISSARLTSRIFGSTSNRLQARIARNSDCINV